MNKTGHSIGCLVMVGTFSYYSKQPWDYTLMAISGIIIGSFIPDIDADYSYFNHKCPILPRIFKFIQKVLPENPVTNHRGALFHSVLTLIPFIVYHKIPFMFGMGLGIFGHHVLDMTTPAGLRYFFPVRKKIGIRRIFK